MDTLTTIAKVGLVGFAILIFLCLVVWVVVSNLHDTQKAYKNRHSHRNSGGQMHNNTPEA